MTDENLGYLAAYDVRGIQEFVFRTLKLRENTGASKIVATIFTEALEAAVKHLKWDDKQYRLDWKNYVDFQFWNDENVRMEVIYTGAGNTYIAYRNEDDCITVNRFVSRYIFENTYSLNLAIAAVPIQSDYEATYRRLTQKLAENKAKMPMTRMIGNLPITRQDPNTGYPFSHYCLADGMLRPVTSESYRKLIKFTQLERESVKEMEDKNVKQLDDLVTEKGIDSRIAVVHIDGNNMGRIFGKVMRGEKNFPEAVKKLRTHSKLIHHDFIDSLEYAEKELERFVESDRCKFKEKYDEKSGKYRRYLRRVIWSGDDITFLCNARVAISLCEIFFKRLTEEQNFSACAGIAFIGSHFPFYAAYQVAEQCCDSAKKRAKGNAKDKAGGSVGNYLDFQICRNISVSNDLESNRKKNYCLSDGTRLLARPYCTDSTMTESDPHHLEFFKTSYRHFSDSDFPDHVAKELRNAYSSGRLQAGMVLNKMHSRGLKLPKDSSKLYQKNEALYFDALEMLDLYLDVEEGNKS